MASFLLLFVICAVASIVVTGLLWPILWLVGVFENPLKRRKSMRGCPEANTERTNIVNATSTSGASGVWSIAPQIAVAGSLPILFLAMTPANVPRVIVGIRDAHGDNVIVAQAWKIERFG